jgi:anti-anti-sigma factor
MGLHIPRLAHRGVAVVRLRGVLSEANAGRLTAVLRQVFTTDPQLVITDLGGLRSWDVSGQRQLAGIAVHLAARGGRMVLCGVGGHLRCTESRLAALGVYPDVPAALIARIMPHSRPARMRRRRPPVPRQGELLRHTYHPMPAQAEQIAAAGEWAKAILASWELPGDADPVIAGLSELTANAVAYGLADTVEITLRLWRDLDDARWLTVAVRDGNPAPPVWRPPTAETAPRGWGLVIMAAHAHSHGWCPDAAGAGEPGKTVWFARRLHRPRPHHHRAPPARS